MEPDIIFEDDSFFVINKPSGWITNDADTTTDQPTVQTWIRNNHKTAVSDSLEYRGGIVHRLDKETSGILLIAKSPHAFTNLQSQFKERKVTKSYIALTHGKLKDPEGVVDAAVGRLPWRRDRFGVLSGGREAVTTYKLIKEYSNETSEFSLVEFFPKTGRTHQIRIHAKYLGNPIVADPFYAGRKTARKDRLWCPRLFLHAAKINFFHPETRDAVNFEAKLPPDLTLALEGLKLLS